MTTVTVHRPGTMREEEGNPDYVIWTFTVTVNCRLRLSNIYMERGTDESQAASLTYTKLMTNPGGMEGITSTGGGPGDAGSPSTPTGPLTGPVIDPDEKDDDDPAKMKTADGT